MDKFSVLGNFVIASIFKGSIFKPSSDIMWPMNENVFTRSWVLFLFSLIEDDMGVILFHITPDGRGNEKGWPPPLRSCHLDTKDAQCAETIKDVLKQS